ncbi:hypothetical protein SAMN05192554_110128 [Haloarchaeobius iranensis]|uniref:DNA methylase N-4/N-6 domain-containing protein n=2 Tax=Haloarchaeobius iranensis TaxID=996166 RepID=A0A1G9XGW6_9EURY|nr:hypothetical protein SAMN05192554_110128 [Haloarchaeobius iranensis]
MQHSSTQGPDRLTNGMQLIDLSQLTQDVDSLEALLDAIDSLWEPLYERMDSTEVLWVIAPNRYHNDRLWPVAMAVADRARKKAGFTLKNTISVHRWSERDSDLDPAYDEILMLVRDKHDYQFYKDEIRVAHVYEGHEWGGKREKGNSAYHDTEVTRYNENGKDPGNVWLEEVRTHSEDQSVDETNPISMPEAVKRLVRVSTTEDEGVHTVGLDSELVEVIEKMDREVSEASFETIPSSEVEA